MQESLKKQWKELDIYVNEFKQGIIIEKKNTIEHAQFLLDFRRYLEGKQKVAFIDFKKLTNTNSLAIELFAQYELLFGLVPQYDIGDSYQMLDSALELFSDKKVTGEVVMWLDNFTQIFKMKEADTLCNMLRGKFQHQDNVVHIFTSYEKDVINEIFSNPKNPFFCFGVRKSLN
jgi:hypothetical protein